MAGHGVWDVLYNANQNLYNLNYELLGWCSGSLLPFAALLAFRRRLWASDGADTDRQRTDRAGLRLARALPGRRVARYAEVRR